MTQQKQGSSRQFLLRLSEAADADTQANILWDITKAVEKGEIAPVFGRGSGTSGWILAEHIVEAAAFSRSMDVAEGAVGVFQAISRQPQGRGVQLALEGLQSLATTTSQPETAAAAIGTARQIFEENPKFEGISIYTFGFQGVMRNAGLKGHFAAVTTPSPVTAALARMQNVCTEIALKRREELLSRSDTQPAMSKAISCK